MNLSQSLKSLPATPLLERRNAAARTIRQFLAERGREAQARLLEDGQGTACAMRLAEYQDEVIRSLFDLACASVAKGHAVDAAVVATGGYGRATLAPGSDIDLLFLLPGQQSAQVSAVVEFMLYALWDAGLKVGQATRQVDECIKLAKGDNTILTAILEARFLCGDLKLFEELQSRFKAEIVQKLAKKYVAEKLAERDTRHAKSGESRYMVEPDLKDGKGGLRDLNTLFWIAKFLFNANSPRELAEKGAFSEAELHKFLKCEDFLWAVRCHLHFIAGRGEDRLSFDRQEELAKRLGYRAGGGLRAVERFMRHYFLIAKDVGDLTRIFCASLEEKHLKDAPRLSRFLARMLPGRAKSQALGQAFKIENGRLTVSAGDVFRKDPVALLRIFRLAGESLTEIHPDALKLIRRSLRLIDDRLRTNPEANAIFLDLLCNSAAPESVLRLMNEAGVLGRFIPEFGAVVAMMQFNMYHHYTVDEHLIRAVGILRALEFGSLAQENPLATAIFPTITGRRALYVATLLHDVAKGRDEDHSIAGERIARSLCPRLGLTPDETDLAAWLVRWHLLMSETAQMRDLNDFKTILDFTNIVQTPERLKLLVILTVADIRAVGPGVWNSWKGQLLRTLYVEAEPLLTGGHTAVTRKERVLAAQAEFFKRLGMTGEAERQAVAARHYDAYWLNVPIERQLRHHQLLSQATRGEIGTEVLLDAKSGITEITILAPDHPRLLAMITGACAAAGANIIGAHIFTTTDGFALDTILLSRAFPEEADERRRAQRVCDQVRRVLHGEVRLREELARMQDLGERTRAFVIAPRVVLNNASSNKNTVVEASGLDRVGLLYALTDALFRLNLNIASAHITTFGEKAVDVFYVTDLTGAQLTESRMKQVERGLLAVWA